MKRIAKFSRTHALLRPRRDEAVEYMDEVSEELKASVIAAIPAEDRLRGLSAEERLRGLSPAELRRLRDWLDQDPSN